VLFWEIHVDNHTEHIKEPSGENAELLKFEAGGGYYYH
jgi:hypothetical protein